MADDLLIRKLVIDELDFDPSVTADGIGVAVKNGVVTLTGHVPSFFEQEAAVRAVQRVRGVRAVAQEMKVRLSALGKKSDDEIAGRALSILNWTMHSEDKIMVVVEGGWITLSGQVDWGFQKRNAEQAVRKLGGVTGVTNRIVVKPRVESADIHDKIIDAFRRSAELDGAGIVITVDGSTVTLSGTVKAWHERELAEDAAWRVPGVTDVRDRISLA